MLWGSNAAASSNVPKNTILANINNENASGPNNTTMFQNTTPGGFISGLTIGLYGVTNTMVAAGESNTSHTTRFLSPGWTLHREFMGQATGLTITAGGSGYSNNDKITVTSALSGTINSGTTLTTNSTGGIVSTGALANSGGLFLNVGNTTVAITNSSGGSPNGTLATLTVTLGGRAGRKQNELLVNVKTMTPASATNPNTAAFPSS